MLGRKRHVHPLRIPVAKNLRGDAPDNGVGRDIFDDDGACRNNAPVPNLHPAPDGDIGTYPDVVTNQDFSVLNGLSAHERK